MRLQVKFKEPDCADCDISIHAKGFIMAVIYWAANMEPLPGWSSIAAVPVDPTGKGTFHFDGKRAIPSEATHVCIRCVTSDLMTMEEKFAEIPERHKIQVSGKRPQADFSVMSDLHLSGKPGKICRALSRADSDTILLSGDLTNDGFTEQFALLKKCIEETVPDKWILSVTGNHDQLYAPDPDAVETYEGYQAFQDYLLQRLKDQGFQTVRDKSCAYATCVKGVDVIGLQCVTYYRKFAFPEGAQLKWLNQHLDKSDGWHIIMCHAPLLAHNPHRTDGAPYLSRNDELQKMIDNHKKIIFISGHTHLSPNMKQSCVEYVQENRTLYVNDGSVTPTELNGEPLMPADWKDGVMMELAIYEDMIEVRTKSIHTGIYYPRGFYRFKLQ